MTYAAAAVVVLAGLVLIGGALRDVFRREIVWATLAALLLGTLLWPTLQSGGDDALAHSTTFALAALAVFLWLRGQSATAQRVASGLALLAAVAIPYVRSGHAPAVDLASLVDTLFSPARGLLFGSPILWGGVIGLGLFARKEWWGAAPLVGGLGLIALAATGQPSNAPLFDGRFHAALPILALGLGECLAWIRSAVALRPGIPLVTVGLALTLWNGLFMEQYRTGRIPRDLPVSFAKVTGMNATLLAGAVGSPPAWPANWLFAWRHGISPAKYDVVAGRSLVDERAQGQALSFDDDRVDPSLIGKGWSSKMSCEGTRCRRVMGTAQLLVPFDRTPPGPFAVRAAGSGLLSVTVNGVLATTAHLEPTMTDVVVPGAGGLWRPGVNEILLSSAPSDEARIAGLRFGSVVQQ